jgi:hypothetical protein
MELHEEDRYWETRVELVSALKEGATSSLMAIPEVKLEVPEGIYVIDVEGVFPSKPLLRVLLPLRRVRQTHHFHSPVICRLLRRL